jgi:hypothetical protein
MLTPVNATDGAASVSVTGHRICDECHLISAGRAQPHERRYFWQHIED